jgi:hypothetical protein
MDTLNSKQPVSSLVKEVSSMTSLASFPSNIYLAGLNANERILLFVRESKVILLITLFIYSIVLFLPFFTRVMLELVNDKLLNGYFNLIFFDTRYWDVIIVGWLAFVLRGYFNIFFKWYYDINMLTTNRFLDMDFLNIFKIRMEETAIEDIEDVKDMQVGIIHSIFNLGHLEILTASGVTAFNLNNVKQASKVRDFVMDVVVENRRRNPKDE